MSTPVLTDPASAAPEPQQTTAPRRHRWRPRVVIPLTIIIGFALIGLIGPILLPYDPTASQVADRLRPPGSTLTDGSVAWLGTDQVGHPLLQQLVAGARISLLVAFATVLIGGAIGLLLGMVGGYFGRWIDAVIGRIGDIQLAFPSILLAILIAGVLGPSVINVIITLAVTRWVVFARIVRASTLVASSSESVDGARVIGVGNPRILRRYILPETIGPLLVAATVQVGQMVIAEASLSFLGLGVPVSQASWGSTIANGRDYLGTAWWISTFPGLFMVVLVIAVGVLGDAFHHDSDVKVAM
ncbi:MAG: ABC transporter permease [Propioniciclava sp.]